MPKEIVTADQAPQLAAVARLMEDLEFSKAADQVLAKLVSVSVDGVIPRAEFLGRQGRTKEALDLLDEHWDDLPLERLLSTGMSVTRSAEKAGAAGSRLDEWIVKAKRIDPGSITVPLLEAELRELQGRQREVETIYRDLLGRPQLSPLQIAIVSNNLAFHLAAPETAEEAGRLIDAAIATLGPHPDLLDTRALVRLAAGDDAAAIADLKQAVLQPSGVKFLHLAYAHLHAGDTDAARSALAKSLEKGLDRERLSAADRTRLSELEKGLEKTSDQAVAEPRPESTS